MRRFLPTRAGGALWELSGARLRVGQHASAVCGAGLPTSWRLKTHWATRATIEQPISITSRTDISKTNKMVAIRAPCGARVVLPHCFSVDLWRVHELLHWKGCGTPKVERMVLPLFFRERRCDDGRRPDVPNCPDCVRCFVLYDSPNRE